MYGLNLSWQNLQKLQEFNKRLHTTQEKILREAIKLDDELIKRVEDADDLLDDYEMELEIAFYLKEDDPSYEEDEDNILETLNEYLKGISQTDIKTDHRWSANHNEFIHHKNHPMKDDFHCWLYHCLYDHTDLKWEDILRIGTIWIDIKVDYQYFNNKN
jgi:lysyl-tRNA synthetase class I